LSDQHLKPRKTLSSWLTNRFLLIIRNEENFAEKTTLSFTYAKLILTLFSALLVLMMGSLILSQTLMAKWFDPRHELIVMDRHLVELADKVDSLERAVQVKDQFIANIKNVLTGKPMTDDSLMQNAQRKAVQPGDETLSPIDSVFRREFEESGVSFVTAANSYARETEILDFFPPIDGLVSRPFNLKIDHYGVDVVSKSNEPIKAVADGTILFADWSQESGNVIAIQHRGNVVSLYKHNSALLKKVGNFVNSGEVIAIIGNSGDLTTGPHLHFELWFNGKPVDPEDFISF
jgi:murein DD-endopeptidase MepM/ murein hydrolase activator NlpD